MKSFSIRIYYNENVLKLFTFATNNDETAEEEFDKAVKEINKIYKENGRFKTQKEVIDHFSKYGFYRVAR